MNAANFKLLVAFGLGFMLSLWVRPACAQQMRHLACIHKNGEAVTLSQALKMLREKYSEAPIGLGSNVQETIMLTVSPEGTWTIITNQGGRACIIAGGKDWRGVAPPKLETAL